MHNMNATMNYAKCNTSAPQLFQKQFLSVFLLWAFWENISVTEFTRPVFVLSAFFILYVICKILDESNLRATSSEVSLILGSGILRICRRVATIERNISHLKCIPLMKTEELCFCLRNVVFLVRASESVCVYREWIEGFTFTSKNAK